MTSSLLAIMNNKKLRDSIKPDSMSRSEYESIVVSLYNKYGDIPINDMQKKLKIRIAISNVING